jgi:hypothetical protein
MEFSEEDPDPIFYFEWRPMYEEVFFPETGQRAKVGDESGCQIWATGTKIQNDNWEPMLIYAPL